jgi:hypothetical protein
VLKFIAEGGWGVFPVMLVGVIAVGLSIAFAVSLRREILPLLGGFWVATLLSGCLGSLVGVRATLRAAEALPALDTAELLANLRESLNSGILGIVFGLLAALVGSAGGFRVAWRAAARAERA